MQIIFRGVVLVSSSLDVQQELNVQLNGFKGWNYEILNIFCETLNEFSNLEIFQKAQKCSFPFTYNSNSYSTCTNADLNYNWCSPSSTYSGQSLKCDPIGKLTTFNYS